MRHNDTVFSHFDALSYRSFDSETRCYVNDRSVGTLWWGSPMTALTDEGLTTLTRFVNEVLPQDAVLQVTFIASTHIQAGLVAWETARTFSPALRYATQKRRAFFEKRALPHKTRHGLADLFYDGVVVVSLTLPMGLNAMGQVNTLAQHWEARVKALNWTLERVPPEGLMKIVSLLTHPNDQLQSPTPRWQRYTSLHEQCANLADSVSIFPTHLVSHLSGWHTKTYAVRACPQDWNTQGMQRLLGDILRGDKRIKTPFVWQLALRPLSRDDTKRRALIKATRWQKLSQSLLRLVMPRAPHVAEEWQTVLQKTESGDILVECAMSAAIMAPAHLMTDVQTHFETLFRQHDWQLMENTYLHYPSLVSLLPMQAFSFWQDFKRLGRLTLQLSEHAVTLMPLLGEYKGSVTPTVLLTGRLGQLSFWDPFSNQTGNYNTAIIGKSRSGKSVFMQELAMSVFAQGGQVFIIDIGRSFEKSCHYVKGNFMEFTREKPISLNPFTHMTSFEAALIMLKPVLATMAAPTGRLLDVELSYLEKALKVTWDRYQNQSTLTLVALWLQNENDKRAHDLATMLYPYTKDGMYGAFFEPPCPLDFNNPYCVVELEDLKGQRDLQTVVLMLILYHMTEKIIRGNREQKKIVLLDEAWDLFQGELSGHFIETGCRRAAKYNGAFVTATQSRQDYDKTPAARAALANSDWTITFAQKREAIDAMQNDNQGKNTSNSLFLNPWLKSLTTVRGEYAECLIQGPQGISLHRLWLEPFSRILTSSTAEEYSEVKRLMAQGQSLEAAVEAVAKRRYGEEEV